MRQRVFAFAAAVSLGLLLVVAAAWARSYWYHDSTDVGRSPDFYFVATTQYGGFSLRLLTGQHYLQRPPAYNSLPYPPRLSDDPRHVIWPSYESYGGSNRSRGAMPIPNMTRYAEIPYWLILL